MKHAMAMVVVLVAMAGACKGDSKSDGTATPGVGEKAAPAAGDPGATATPPAAGTGGEAKDKPALPSIGDDPSPAKICARLAAAAAAEGGQGQVEWNHLASECEKNLAEAMSARTAKYLAFAECMREKETFTAVMKDCDQLE